MILYTRCLLISMIACCLFACGKTATEPLSEAIYPRLNVKDFGAKGDGFTNDDTAISRALRAANEKKLPLFFPAGKYLARIILPNDSLIIFGEKARGRFFDSSGTVILGLLNCNLKKHIRISDLSIDARGRLLITDDAALTSGTTPGNQPLDHEFSNIAILGNGYNEYKHGILCFSGSGIQMSNIYVSSFYHGIALRCSNAALSEISTEYCGFTSIVVKSADSLNNHAKNVSIRRVSIYGDHTDPFRRGGVILIISYNAKSITENITVDSVSSVNGGVGAVNVEQDSGLVRNISISNCFAWNCCDRITRATYDIYGGTNISYTNCNTVKSAGAGFRSSNNPVNLVVRSCYESQSRFPWIGSFTYLQLNGMELYRGD